MVGRWRETQRETPKLTGPQPSHDGVVGDTGAGNDAAHTANTVEVSANGTLTEVSFLQLQQYQTPTGTRSGMRLRGAKGGGGVAQQPRQNGAS